MEEFEKEFIGFTYCYPARNAVYAATKVEQIREVNWKDLGMPESLWYVK